MENSDTAESHAGLNLTDMRRVPPYGKVKIADLVLEDVEFDPIFYELYCKFLLGESFIAYTRISTARIASGFLREDSKGNLEHVRDPGDPRVVQHLATLIRGGRRPALHVYGNRFSSPIEFLCPDDAVTYEAYRLLGIQKVPVAILKPRESDLEESAIFTLRCTTPDGGIEYIHHTSSAEFDSVESFLGSSPPESFEIASGMLIESIECANQCLRAFHLSGIVDLHYHHTLSSTLFRLAQAIRGMQVMVEKGLYYQALTLLRSMYELVLFFYIDWLAPQIIGPWLQLSAGVSKRRWTEKRRAYYEEKKAEGWDPSTIKTLLKADNRTYDLVSRVSKKARINPLNRRHSELYGYLSQIVHQDFTMTARYAHTLENDMDFQRDKALLADIIVFADVLAAQVVSRVVADTGDPKSP